MVFFVKNQKCNIFSILALILLLGCKNEGSLLDLFRFPPHQDIRLQVDLLTKHKPEEGPPLNSEEPAAFYLSAESLRDATLLELLASDGSSATSLRVDLGAVSGDFETRVRVPYTLSAGQPDFAVVVKLWRQEPRLFFMDEAAPPLLSALLPQFTSQDAPLSTLSVESTLATRLVLRSFAHPQSPRALSAYQKLTTLFAARLEAIEAAADVNAAPLTSEYLSAMVGGLELRLLLDADLQKEVIETLLAGISEEADVATDEVQLVSGFTRVLLEAVAEVQDLFLNPASPASRVFNPGYIDPTAVGALADFKASVFAPRGLSFSDSDPEVTIGGEVEIEPPQLTRGIASYKIYLGGEERAQSRSALLGTVLGESAPLILSVPAGTPIPTGASRLWVYAVTRDAKELDVPASLALSPYLKLPSPAAFHATEALASAGAITVSWEPSLGAEAYSVRRGQSPGSCPTLLSTRATSPYTDTAPLLGVTNYYCIDATNAFGSTTAPEILAARTSWPTLLSGAAGSPVSSIDVEIDSKGNIYSLHHLTGSWDNLSPIGSRDVFLQKFSASGQKMWSRRWGSPLCAGTDELIAADMTIDTADDIYVVGSTCGPLSTDPSVPSIGEMAAFLVKFTTGGQHLFTRFFGTSSGSELGVSGARTAALAITHDPLDNIYVAGRTNGDLDGETKTGDVDGFLLRLATDGSRLWTRLVGATGVSYPWTVHRRLIARGSEAIYLIGQTSDSHRTDTSAGSLPGQSAIGGRDSYLMLYQADGQRSWIRQRGVPLTGGSAYLDFEDIAEDPEGAIYIGGTVQGNYGGSGLSGQFDRFVEKLSAAGASAWIVQSGSASGRHSFKSLAWSAGAFLLAGGSSEGTIDLEPSRGIEDAVVTAYSSGGDRLWTKRLGRSGQRMAASRLFTVDGGAFLLAGEADFDLSLPYSWRAVAPYSFLIKRNAAGEP